MSGFFLHFMCNLGIGSIDERVAILKRLLIKSPTRSRRQEAAEDAVAEPVVPVAPAEPVAALPDFPARMDLAANKAERAMRYELRYGLSTGDATFKIKLVARHVLLWEISVCQVTPSPQTPMTRSTTRRSQNPKSLRTALSPKACV